MLLFREGNVLQPTTTTQLTADIFIDEGEKAEATAIEEARIIAVVFMVIFVKIMILKEKLIT